MVALVLEAVNIHVSATAGVQERRTVDWYTIYQVNSKSQVTSQRTQQ